LYLASDIDTAIAESRPLIKDRMTLGKFKVKSALNIIDLRDPKIKSPFEPGLNLKLAIRYMAYFDLPPKFRTHS
jgi:hypothetical protein